VSGYADDKARERCKDSGFHRRLIKLLNFADLYKIIESLGPLTIDNARFSPVSKHHALRCLDCAQLQCAPRCVSGPPFAAFVGSLNPKYVELPRTSQIGGATMVNTIHRHTHIFV
jgi:hypothetical protein